MKKIIRLYALIAAAAFTAILFAACSSGSSSSSKTASSSSSSSKASSSSSSSSESSLTSSEESSESSSEADTSDTSGPKEAGILAPEADDVLGRVTEITETGFVVSMYDGEIEDYTDISGVQLSDTEVSETVTLEEDAVFESVSAGILGTAAKSDVAEGDLIAVTKAEDGAQRVIVLEYEAQPEDGETADEESSSSSSAA